MEYCISTKDQRDIIRLTATSYEEAARKAVRGLSGRKHGLFAMRTTGIVGMSGWFQGYAPVGDGASTSTGEPFHVARTISL